MSDQIPLRDVTPPAKTVDLYASREKIYTRAFTGLFRNLRMVANILEVVRDHHERCALGLGCRGQSVHDLPAGGAIEGAGRLGGDENAGGQPDVTLLERVLSGLRKL